MSELDLYGDICDGPGHSDDAGADPEDGSQDGLYDGIFCDTEPPTKLSEQAIFLW